MHTWTMHICYEPLVPSKLEFLGLREGVFLPNHRWVGGGGWLGGGNGHRAEAVERPPERAVGTAGARNAAD